MTLAVPARRAVWHPLVGAVLVTVPALVAVHAVATGAGSSAGAGTSAFLAMGAAAGFSVSGST